MARSTLVLIEASGDPHERGVSRGLAAPGLIRSALAEVLNPEVRRVASLRELEELSMLMAGRMPEVLEELDGISAATGISARELLMMSTVSDLTGRLPGWCSLVARHDGHNWLLGKNLDSTAQLGRLQVVERVVPRHGYPFVHVTTAGACWTDGGVNGEGLALVNASVATTRRPIPTASRTASSFGVSSSTARPSKRPWSSWMPARSERWAKMF